MSDELSRSSWASRHRVSKRLRNISQVKISWCLRATERKNMWWRIMERSLMTVSNWNSRHASKHCTANTTSHIVISTRCTSAHNHTSRLVNVELSSIADIISPPLLQYRQCYCQYFWKEISTEVSPILFCLKFWYWITDTLQRASLTMLDGPWSPI